MPSHTHTLTDPGHTHVQSVVSVGFTGWGGTGNINNTTTNVSTSTTGITIANAGSGTAMDFAVQYVDVIIATKD
jgi:hypothetical protein